MHTQHWTNRCTTGAKQETWFYACLSYAHLLQCRIQHNPSSDRNHSLEITKLYQHGSNLTLQGRTVWRLKHICISWCLVLISRQIMVRCGMVSMFDAQQTRQVSTRNLYTRITAWWQGTCVNEQKQVSTKDYMPTTLLMQIGDCPLILKVQLRPTKQQADMWSQKIKLFCSHSQHQHKPAFKALHI